MNHEECYDCYDTPCSCRPYGDVVRLDDHRAAPPRAHWSTVVTSMPQFTQTPPPAKAPKNAVSGTVVAHPSAVTEVNPPRVLPTRIDAATGTQVGFLASNAVSAQLTRALLTNSYQIAAGTGIALKALWNWLTLRHYTQAADAAQHAGDYHAASHIASQRQRALHHRHQRMKEAPQVAAALALLTAFCVAFGFVATVFLAATVHFTGNGDFLTIMGTLFGLIGATASALFYATPMLMLATPAAAILFAWHLGRTRSAPPSWVVTTASADVSTEITEDALTQAIAALRIPAITQHLKNGHKLQFITGARRDGRGTHAVIRLPRGVTAEQLVKRRHELASGLYRSVKEVWPTVGAEEGISDLWIADQGVLDQGAGPWPVLNDGPTSTDVYKGIPFGRTLRGEEVKVPLVNRNTMIGGMPGQGKSSGARVLMAGLALDPTVELRIYVPDTNFDFDAFAPRCSAYLMGADDAILAAIAKDFATLEDEVQHRGQLLVQHQAQDVTPKLARSGVGLHMVVVLIEEAHVLIQDKVLGREFADRLERIVKLGRKRNIHIIVSTQAPTADSMPRNVTRNCSTGVAYAVGDHIANDALLGQGAYRAHHRATELIPGTDTGTCVLKGATNEARSERVQTYRLRTDDVPAIIDVALANIRRTGQPIPGTGTSAYTPVVVESRDFLDDVLTVLDGQTVRAANIPALLQALAPEWAPYRNLNGKELRRQLKEQGVHVPSTGNTWPLRPKIVLEAMRSRNDAHSSGPGEEPAWPGYTTGDVDDLQTGWGRTPRWPEQDDDAAAS